ncbi:hypothetical protein SAY86_019710 [Trapa natans]|uniref:Uncharacterized protein n=1 Tax=Trapa natans TaxID=22666 RepID=A0AAN7M183_TRANT|nr:hypothetical protein SAY86_019710 [Trapa natans]
MSIHGGRQRQSPCSVATWWFAVIKWEANYSSEDSHGFNVEGIPARKEHASEKLGNCNATGLLAKMAELSQISAHSNLYGAVSQGHIMEDRLTLKGKEGNRKKRWISLLGSPQFSLIFPA